MEITTFKQVGQKNLNQKKTKMSKVINKLKDSSNLIPKIGRKGKANWIFFDKPKTKMTEQELSRCKDFLDYFNVKWDGDKIKLTSGGNSIIANPNTEWKDFLGVSINSIAQVVAKKLGKEVYWDENDYY